MKKEKKGKNFFFRGQDFAAVRGQTRLKHRPLQFRNIFYVDYLRPEYVGRR